MSQVIRWRCDGCGTLRVELPADWLKVETWEDGSAVLHYCPRCKKRRSSHWRSINLEIRNGPRKEAGE